MDTKVFEGEKDSPDHHDIELDNISFSYNGEDNVLENVSLHIDHGERIAIVGDSGAGKSTLVQLISWFYDIMEGVIRIGGRDIREIDYEGLLENISVVFQESFLTRESIFDNIAMGKEGITLDMVREARQQRRRRLMTSSCLFLTDMTQEQRAMEADFREVRSS